MKEKLSSFVGSVRAFWSGISRKMRIVLLSSTAAILAISLGVVIWLNRSDYVVLYDGLSVSDSAVVLTQLQEMGVNGVLEGDRIMVPSGDEDRVRMQLAVGGYRNAGFDYETYARGAGMTATAAEREHWYNFELQDRLKATLETFDEVQMATVNISMPKENSAVLVSEVDPPKAGVKLDLKPGQQLTANQIQGILNLVQSSVPGLALENISLVDQSGDLLGTMRAGADISASKLALTEQVNDSVRRQVLTILGPYLGYEGVHVTVNTELDLDQEVKESNEYKPLDPNDPFRNPIDLWEREREKTGPGGFAEGVPGATPNTDVPEYAGVEGEVEEADYYRDHEIVDYLVGSERIQTVKEGYRITDMHVAVLINENAFPPAVQNDPNANRRLERSEIVSLVATAAGVSENNISVQIIPFAQEMQGNGGNATAEDSNLWLLIAIGAGAAALLLIVALIVMSMRRSRRERNAYMDGDMDAYQEATLVDLLSQDDDFEPIIIPESNEAKLKAQIKDLANTDPEIVAQLIKTWLMESQ